MSHNFGHAVKYINLPGTLYQIGSWAGNLMLTHDNDNFPSDVYTIMEAVGATVTIGKIKHSIKFIFNSMFFYF